MLPAFALNWIVNVEGGFVDNVNDPGGATYVGITAPAVVGLDLDKDGRLDFDLDGDGDVDEDDIRALASSPQREEKVAAFYGRIWNVVGELWWPADLLAFDAIVHHGEKAGIALLQKALWLKPDGIIGPQTLEQARRVPASTLLRAYYTERAELFRRICNKREKSRGFLLGWLNRLALLKEECFRSRG